MSLQSPRVRLNSSGRRLCRHRDNGRPARIELVRNSDQLRPAQPSSTIFADPVAVLPLSDEVYLVSAWAGSAALLGF